MAAASQPAEPAPRALRRLMAERGLSQRKLSVATREINDTGLSGSTIGNFARGDDRPSPRALELLARAAGEKPGYFAEVRLARARRLLDEREVGLDEALRNLAKLEPALTGPSGASAAVAGFAAEAAEAERESSEDTGTATVRENPPAAQAPRNRRSA